MNLLLKVSSMRSRKSTISTSISLCISYQSYLLCIVLKLAMAKFSKELRNFLVSTGRPEIRTGRQAAQYLRKIPASPFYISAGHILAFRYGLSTVIALIVSTGRGNGLFISTRHNPLVTVFRLEGVSDVILKEIVKSLYRNPRLASYRKVVGTLRAILGKDRFRTFNLRKMSGIHQVELRRDIK